jgi:hypothetical protein
MLGCNTHFHDILLVCKGISLCAGLKPTARAVPALEADVGISQLWQAQSDPKRSSANKGN